MQEYRSFLLVLACLCVEIGEGGRPAHGRLAVIMMISSSIMVGFVGVVFLSSKLTE